MFEQIGEVEEDDWELEAEELEASESAEELRRFEGDDSSLLGDDVACFASSLDQESLGWACCSGSWYLVGVTFCEICGFLGGVVDEEMDDEEEELLPPPTI